MRTAWPGLPRPPQGRMIDQGDDVGIEAMLWHPILELSVTAARAFRGRDVVEGR